MKRTITFLILTLFLLSMGAKNARAEEIFGQISVSTNETVVPTQGDVNMVVTSESGGVDLSSSLITWSIDKNRIIKQGIGLINLTIPTEYNTIYVKVRVDASAVNTGSTYHVAELELTPGLQSQYISKSDKLTAIETANPNKDFKLVSSPPSPRMFQRVAFTLTNSGTKDITKNLIKWTLNGKVVSEEMGQTVYVTRSASPSKTITIRAEVEGMELDGAWGEITFVPRDDPRLKLRDTKATRIANCASQSLRMLQRDINVINKRIDMFVEKYKSSKENITRDVAFLQDLILKLPEELARTAKDLFKTATTFTVARKGDPLIIKIADQIREFGQMILDNDISSRIAYIQKQLDYYVRLINWFEATQYNIQAETASMIRRIDKQKEKCIEIANERPDDLIETNSIKEFRKYEW